MRFNTDAPDNVTPSDDGEEYDVGFGEAGANEVEVLELEPNIALDTVDSETAQDPLDGESIGNLFSENDAGDCGNENIEYLEIEPLHATDASAASIKDEPFNLEMLNLSLDNNVTTESNTSDCVITAAYYAFDEEYVDTDEN